jgi:hypothetical protein
MASRTSTMPKPVNLVASATDTGPKPVNLVASATVTGGSVKPNISILPLLLVSLSVLCRPSDLGSAYARQVTEEAVIAAKSHLREPEPASRPGSSQQTEYIDRLARSAEQTFRKARLVEIGPCSATLAFFYEHEGATQRASVDLEYESTTDRWRVVRMFLQNTSLVMRE